MVGKQSESIMKIKRRKFIAQSAAGLGGLILGSRFDDTRAKPLENFDPYEIVPLGRTDITVSRVGMGTGMRGFNRQSNQTRLGKEKFEALIQGAYERGVRLVDMADIYGSHPYILSALSNVPRDELTMVTKIWTHRGGIPEEERPSVEQVVNRFLQELNTDYLDVVLLHCMMTDTWNTDLRPYMDGLAELKQKGVIRAHGISCHDLGALEKAADDPWVDSVHARINAYGHKMDGPPEEVVPILHKIHEAGKGIIGMKLIGEGDFRDDEEKRNRSVDFVLNLGCVDAMVVGFESTEEIDDFAGRVRAVERRA